MSAETTTNEPQRPIALRLRAMRPMLLLLVPVLLGIAIYLSVPASSANIKVWGQLSASDVQAIRRGVARWRQRDLGNAIRHLRFGMFWDQVRVLHTCPWSTSSRPTGGLVPPSAPGGVGLAIQSPLLIPSRTTPVFGPTQHGHARSRGEEPNHTMQRMRASGSCQSQFGRPWRLARTADGERWAALREVHYG